MWFDPNYYFRFTRRVTALSVRGQVVTNELERIPFLSPFCYGEGRGGGVGSDRGAKGGGGTERGRVGRRQVHSLATLQVLALIHGQATSASTEAVSFRAELATVAHFAK